MATTVPEIRVFAMFPTDPDPPSWKWIQCLTAIDTLNSHQGPTNGFAVPPGLFVGVHGDLSFSPDSPHDIDCNRDFPSESTELFYHTTDAERGNMFPADPDMDRTNITSISSGVTSRRAEFRGDVEEQDGVCVLTGYQYQALLCDGAHLLPHSKGDEYIETYTRRRSRGCDRNDIVYEIDDVRNGILLNKYAHCTFGTDVAFLVTPNFAMSNADVDPTAPPTERCIAHLFVPDKPEYLGSPALRSGSPVRMPDTADEWPPDILFDAVYANAVLHHFASQTMRDTLRRWESTFYPGGITSAAQASHQAITDERAIENERRKERKRAREQRAARRENRVSRASDDRDVDYFDFLMILPYIFMSPDEQGAV